MPGMPAIWPLSVPPGLIAGDKNFWKGLTNYAEKIGLAFQIKDDILSEIGDEKVLGKPVGNDREKGKCTYVTKYGLDEAEKMLSNQIEEAIECIKEYETEDEFLSNLALYIKNRNK